MSWDVKLPFWAWGGIAFILCTLTGGLGTWAGYTLLDHEKRIVQLEATQLTGAHVKELMNELKRDIRMDMQGVKTDINSMRTDVAQMRRDLDRSQPIK